MCVEEHLDGINAISLNKKKERRKELLVYKHQNRKYSDTFTLNAVEHVSKQTKSVFLQSPFFFSLTLVRCLCWAKISMYISTYPNQSIRFFMKILFDFTLVCF